ncbi:MAG: NAD-dependent epimerase/dehydratase family protein [Microbacterium sp.]|uniref:NAD-dependent epimerase/dehydratase family protein n=1 Tax=Microbacterium sp. TaxID=51671 RepID=UPI001ACF9823|nr:NAD-dependent epimerase/dehydratase family protein [Microbacterium sp.]MBN9015229.1 NAD-dependent epimerase/dehydratase family protein [Hyphomicrobiales bacterium]MBN9177781.1 NAD-dependent epimerase/dehydratase family protein [Microbacterium sp.]
MSRFVVTGHAGFIGFHVARQLLEHGHEVLGVDAITDYYDPSLKRSRLQSLRHFDKLVGEEFELEDADRLLRSITNFEPDVIIHLAAQAGVRYSLEAPFAYIQANLVGTFNLLEAARISKPKHLLLASSSSIYGGNQSLPWSETDRTDSPMSLYAATKKGTEDLAHSYSSLWGIPTTAFRFFTVYGPMGRPDMALYKFVKAAFDGDAIDVYGHGKMRRDFTYIDDLVRAIVALINTPPVKNSPVGTADSLSPVAPYRSVNLGGGVPVELMSFIESVEQATGRTLKKNMLPMQMGDVLETYSETTLLRELIGEIPRTPVTTGVVSFVDWYKSYFHIDSTT